MCYCSFLKLPCLRSLMFTMCDSLFVCLQVEFSVEKSSFHLLVDGVRVTDGHLPNEEGSSLDLMNPVYLGGDLKGRTTKVCISLSDGYWQLCHKFSSDFLLFSSLRVTVSPWTACSGAYETLKWMRKLLESQRADTRPYPALTGSQKQGHTLEEVTSSKVWLIQSTSDLRPYTQE